MCARKSVFANPFLICILKYIWLNRISDDCTFTDNDYSLLEEKSELSVESLKRRIIRADEQIHHFKESTLDKLCKGVSQKVSGFWPTWREFRSRFSEHDTFHEFARLSRLSNGSRIRSLGVRYEGKMEKMRIQARAEAKSFFDLHSGVEIDIGRSLPDIDLLFLKARIKVADKKDIEGIYDLAKRKKSYGDCVLNGPETKIPWWRQNNKTFYVIHDANGRVCANLNILPLKEEAYKRLRSGRIAESDIAPEDVHTPDEREKVKYMLIEGFNCPNAIHAYLFLEHCYDFASMLSSDPLGVTIGAYGVTSGGVNLMKKLNFKEISGPATTGQQYPFLEVAFQALPERFRKQGKEIFC